MGEPSYREDRIRRDPLAGDLPFGADILAIEVGRLLASVDVEDIGYGDVIEALATYTLDLGVYDQFHRYTLCAYGVARGFIGDPLHVPSDQMSAAGWRVGNDARTIYEAWRES